MLRVVKPYYYMVLGLDCVQQFREENGASNPRTRWLIHFEDLKREGGKTIGLGGIESSPDVLHRSAISRWIVKYS